MKKLGVLIAWLFLDVPAHAELDPGWDIRAVRVVLSARQCVFSQGLKESRKRPGPDIEKPEVFELLLADTKAHFDEVKLSPLGCKERLIKNVMACLPSVAGGVLNIPLACSVLRQYLEIDEHMPLPKLPEAPPPAPTSPIDTFLSDAGPSKKVVALLHSAQACANEKAAQLTASYGARLRKMGIGEGDDPAPYRRAALEARKAMKEAQVSALACSNPSVKKLIYCLKSVEEMGIGAIGTPYGGPWCDEEPFSAAVRLEGK